MRTPQDWLAAALLWTLLAAAALCLWTLRNAPS